LFGCVEVEFFSSSAVRWLAESGGDLPGFYARVRELGALDKPTRTAALRRLAPQLAHGK
jgi:predicted aminopeptidase